MRGFDPIVSAGGPPAEIPESELTRTDATHESDAEHVVRHFEAMYERARVDFTGMNGSQIMAFMSRVMRDVDTRIGARANVLESRNDQSAKLAKEIAVLEQIRMLADNNEDGNVAISGEAGPEMQIKGMKVEEFLKANGMEHLLEDMPPVDRSDGGQYIKKHDIQGAIDNRKAQQSTISSMSEMDMIEFQSLVQTRQLFVNLATQMMNAQHEGQSNVVRNIG